MYVMDCLLNQLTKSNMYILLVEVKFTCTNLYADICIIYGVL